MTNDFQFSDFINELSILTKMENIWSITCGTWKNCNEATIQSFLTQCMDYNIDPHFCLNWVKQHQDEIPNWSMVSATTLGWVNEHTITESATNITAEDLS